MTVIQTYRANKTARVNGEKRQAGELVPEAILFSGPARAALLHSGHLREVHLSIDELAEAVAKYCPADAGTIYDAHGLSETVRPAIPEAKEQANGRRGKQAQPDQQGVGEPELAGQQA